MYYPENYLAMDKVIKLFLCSTQLSMKFIILINVKMPTIIPGLEVIKLFLCSSQLSMKFIMLINVKMPTIVGILSFNSMINTASERLKARKVVFFTISDYMSSSTFMLS